MALGYDKALYLLAFDHRGSFQKKLFGIQGQPSAAETARIAEAKSVILDGFLQARSEVQPEDAAGILVDEQYGADLARRARKVGAVLAMPVEASGRDEFDFEYGEAFGEHIEAFDPSFSKVLVRYNPEGDAQANRAQTRRLKVLSDWLHERDRKFLFELLVPATAKQLAAVGGSSERYDREVRPDLVVRSMAAMQEAGVEADLWKIEGLDERADCVRVAEQARSGGRDRVACVVLGRGASREKVEHWLRTGSGVPGYCGFAIGRTIWWDALVGFRDGRMPRRDSVRLIADNYLGSIESYRARA